MRVIKMKKINLKLSAKRAAFVFLGIFVISAVFATVFVYKLLDNFTYTKVPVVDELIISDGILDDVKDPNEDTTPEDTIYDDTYIEDKDNSDSKNKYVYVPPTSWGEGNVKLYVDERFPIKRVQKKDKNVENYLIFGIDARATYEVASRTDSIIIVSVDSKNNSIKLTSILRDTQVRLPGRTNPVKINAAYVFGGVGLLINTINDTFDLDIQKFAMVDMWSSEKIIDAIGGVNIEITQEEIRYINGGVSGSNSLFKKISEPSPLVKESGNVLLNGRQAVAYGRIRSIGSDFGRTQRQRNVLTQVILKFKQANPSRKLAVFEETARAFNTNIKKQEMIYMAFDVLYGMRDIRQYTVPERGMFTSNTYNYQLAIDHSRQNPMLHSFIWGNSDSYSIKLPEEAPDPTPTPTPEPTLTPEPTPTPEPQITPETESENSKEPVDSQNPQESKESGYSQESQNP